MNTISLPYIVYEDSPSIKGYEKDLNNHTVRLCTREIIQTMVFSIN